MGKMSGCKSCDAARRRGMKVLLRQCIKVAETAKSNLEKGDVVEKSASQNVRMALEQLHAAEYELESCRAAVPGGA